MKMVLFMVARLVALRAKKRPQRSPTTCALLKFLEAVAIWRPMHAPLHPDILVLQAHTDFPAIPSPSGAARAGLVT